MVDVAEEWAFFLVVSLSFDNFSFLKVNRKKMDAIDQSKLDSHAFVLWTEAKLKECESSYPEGLMSDSDWTMWLPKEKFQTDEENEVSLVPVKEFADWEKMLEMRLEIEKEFGVEDPQLVRSFIEDIKNKSRKLNGTWFLAKYNEKFVGEIGLVTFDFNGNKVGRLQDVDILPTFQGKGLGTKLLRTICSEASAINLDALCLMAKSDDWPKDWYARFGFKKVGTTS